ncbi:hypothetical protein [Acidianus ambivalens]|uniref:MFS transporter n=1 Tax=Acidianus ambivalens TaxID=2283 RepID=A0A650CU36_ACIAM|nr:hypothetical protein [Acidianus ambivalens]MQL56131.1 hypothetical protein [Acidianus ambivalens]QGR21326.1 hypothetical protein D1866_04455 [Acidianus ambivalens]
MLRKIIVSNIAYSLPNALFSLFFVYLIYYSFHLPPILIGLLTVTSISGRLIGNKLARITNITRKSNWILYLIYIIPDFLIGVFLFLTNVQYLPLIYLVFFINGILGSVVGYYYSLAKYKLIPKDVYATSSSVISVISSIFDYIFTVVSSIIISLISYQGAILMSLILFIGLDTYFVPFFVNVIKSIETDSEK